MFPLLCDYIGFSLSEYDRFLSSDKTAPQLFVLLPLTKLMSCLCLADCFLTSAMSACFLQTTTRPYMFRNSSIGPNSNLITLLINLCGQSIWPLHFGKPVQINLHFCIISEYVKRSRSHRNVTLGSRKLPLELSCKAHESLQCPIIYQNTHVFFIAMISLLTKWYA